ncbi:unnamed protein product [Rotaria magnacalcarata]|uniref:RING-type domain-containing protein n=1 Tax=Rotaria magnacalcarata TaxID=392030 RepID=A0A815RFE3_9BILA|nr:unnamed protein product [Rotaria magnacalcarata]CAF4051348.1 unnamed protein product [Rotaria magnacalcarata]
MNNDSNKSVEQSNSIAADRVQGSFDEDLVTCSICHMILWKPVACKTCENSFCSDCINQWQQKQPNKCPFTCHYEERKCIGAILKVLSRLQINCCYMQNGCSVAVPYEGLEKHEQQCDYQFKKCEGCQRELLLKDLAQHQELCDQIDLKCSTCETLFKRKDMKNHKEVQCLKQQLQQQKNQVQELKLEFKQEIQQLKETMEQKLKNQQDTIDQLHVKNEEMQEECLNVVKKQIQLHMMQETFDSVYSNTLKIEEHGLVVVLIGKREHSEVRGRNSYSSGINCIKFQIEKMLNNEWISFGVLSQSTPMASTSFSSPSFYG